MGPSKSDNNKLLITLKMFTSSESTVLIFYLSRNITSNDDSGSKFSWSFMRPLRKVVSVTADSAFSAVFILSLKL